MEEIKCKICSADITNGVQEYVGEFYCGDCYVCSICYIKFDDMAITRIIRRGAITDW